MSLSDPLYAAWILGTSVITAVGMWLCMMPQCVPKGLVPVLIYGKASEELVPNSFAKWTQVPKKWFVHFYVYAVVQNVILFSIMNSIYFYSMAAPNTLLQLMDLLVPTRHSTVDPQSAYLAMLFILIHTSRRLYECVYVSVYSPSSMNALHYALGYLFYWAITFVLITEAPGFQSTYPYDDSFGTLRWCHFVGTVLFVYGSYHHHETHVIFANLRKDAKGTVVTKDHFMPSGGLFEYVSCPHYFAEIVIYIALAVVLELRHTGWWLVVAWTIGGQVVTALTTHRWYLKKYKDYPKNRRAVIPFLL